MTTAPYLPDTPAALARTLTHRAAARLVLPSGEEVSLDLEGGTLSWDETRSPRVEANLMCNVPTDQATLDRIDPRTGARLEVDAGYVRPDGLEDVQTIADLGLRSREVSRPDDRMSLNALGDEATVLDAARSGTNTLTTAKGTSVVASIIEVIRTAQGITITPTVTAPAGAALTANEQYDDRWDMVQGLADRIGAQVYDNGLRNWYIATAPTLGTVALDLTVGEAGTIVSSDAGLSRDDGFANYVYLRHEWTDTAGAAKKIESKRRITTGPYAASGNGSTRALEVVRQTSITQADADLAAATLVARTVTRGRTFTVSAVSAYWLRPGHTVNVTLPLGGTEKHLVVAVTFDLKTGLMTVTTRLPDNTGTIGA